MNVLVVVPYPRYYSNFYAHLEEILQPQKVTIEVVMPPYYSFYAKTRKFLSKSQVLLVMCYNIFFFLKQFWRLRYRRQHDTIILASHVIAIPFLLVSKLFTFPNTKKIFLISFFLHDWGDNWLIKKVLGFLLNNSKIEIVVQSPSESEYYSKVSLKPHVAYYPFCQHEINVAENAGRGENYIFAGGYSNRDYDCLFKAAAMVDHQFIVVCSRLNHIQDAPANVKLLCDLPPEMFNGYLKNAKIVIIPLKENTGASGQMVALAAMSFEKPVIYTNLDAISQYFDENQSGISYLRGDSDDLANKINSLLSTPEMQRAISEKAYHTYKEKYHISVFCNYLARSIQDASAKSE